MLALGIRCSNKDYSCCILSGTRDNPLIESNHHVSFPTGYSESDALRWFHQEMEAIFGTASIDLVGIKRAETMVKRSNSLEQRIQNEAIVSLVAAQKGCTGVSKKVNSTIAKDLGLKGKGKYLKTKLDTSAFPDFDSYPDKMKEAILVAWSCMS